MKFPVIMLGTIATLAIAMPADSRGYTSYYDSCMDTVKPGVDGTPNEVCAELGWNSRSCKALDDRCHRYAEAKMGYNNRNTRYVPATPRMQRSQGQVLRGNR